MFTCRACTKRYLQILIGDSTIPCFSPQLSLTPRKVSRTFASSTANRTADESSGSNYRPVFDSESSPEPIVSATEKRQKWLESRGTTPDYKKAAAKYTKTDSEVLRKLKHLSDPLKLATFTRTLLGKDDFEAALLYVRSASKTMQCEVSWNHLIEWQFGKGDMTGALKTYNEMKKRAQFPDAQTYTIIFKCLSESPYHRQALEKGLAIYTSMQSERSRMKPNITHTNAILRLCARAGDLDALLGIARDMPSDGVGAPNNLTFTTILNAFRMQAIAGATQTNKGTLTQANQTGLKHNNDETINAKLAGEKARKKAIQNAHRMWGDIYSRWRKADIFIDEELVCAIGRTLELGNVEDNDDILSLIEQTMNIPRQIPRRGTEARRLMEPSLQKSHAGVNKTLEAKLRSEDSPATSSDDVFAISSANPTSVSTNLYYASPGCNTLSMVMQALLNMEKKDAAVSYWKLFTEDFSVTPDAENYHAYLRVLRVSRSSAEAARLIESMPPTLLSGKTFLIAISACLRDSKSRNSFAHASRIIKQMQQHLRVPEIRALTTYLEVSVKSTPQDTRPGREPTAYARGQQILLALDYLGPLYVNLRALLMYGDPTNESEAKYWNNADFRANVILLIRRIISAYDILMKKSLVDPEMHPALTARCKRLMAYIARYRKLQDPNHRSDEQVQAELDQTLPEIDFSAPDGLDGQQLKRPCVSQMKRLLRRKLQRELGMKPQDLPQDALRGYLARNDGFPSTAAAKKAARDVAGVAGVVDV